MKKLLLISLLTLCACTANELAPDNISSLVDIESVTMVAHNFFFEDSGTKTSLTISDTEGALFSWVSDDIVGVFPNIDGATQVKFPISDGSVSGGTSTSNANFTGNGWAVMKANKYMAYYPFASDMDLDKRAIPVDYTGQNQYGSGSTAHLNRFDHMAAAATSPSSNGNIGLDFQHLGSLLQLNLTVPKIAEYTSLSLSCDDAQFITKGTIDLTAGTPAIAGTEYSHEFHVSLSNFSTTTINQSMVVYVMIPPVDMSNRTIHVRLRGPHADFSTHFSRGVGKPFRPGGAYRPTLEAMQGGDVDLLENGEQFNKDIKTLVNGEDYILEKNDYLIRHIVFRANDSTVPSLPHVDVSDESATHPIYASFDSSTGTLYVSSADPKVYANSNPGCMFVHLKKLETIDFTDFSTSYSTTMRSLFEDCPSITALNLSGFDLSNVGHGRYASCSAYRMFADCTNLTSITWPSLLTFNKEDDIYQDIGGMYCGCKSLANIDMSCLSGCRITSIQSTFGSCHSLASIDLSGLDFADCYGYTSAFSGCTSLTSLDVSNFAWNNIDGECIMVFAGCSALETLNLGNFTIENGGRLDSIFEGCSSLSTLNYTNFDVSAKTLSSFFQDCSSMTSLPVDGLVRSNTTAINAVFLRCYSLASLDLSSWNTSNVTTFADLFADCRSLTSLNLSSFRTYEATNMHSMFRGCSELLSINWGSNFNTEKVTDLSNMFGQCSKLTTLDLSCFSTGKVINFSDMFAGCTSLASITWGNNFDTHYAQNFDSMFYDCSSLTSLDLRFFNTSSATNMDNMFRHCTSLTTLDITSFTTEHFNGVSATFYQCTRLAELRIGTGFTVSQFPYALGNLADDIAQCTIYCPESFMNNVYAYEHEPWCLDLSRIVWKNIQTNATMTYPGLIP